MENNPCDCIWNHELAMRRLLSLLRQSQSVCADTECYDELPALPSAEGSVENASTMMIGMMWLAVGFLLYMLRPSALGNVKNMFKKPFNNNDDNNNEGPPGMSPGVH